MKTARAAAVMTWIYAAGFGGTAIPVAAYLKTRGHLPTFMGMFEMYGGPRLAHVQQRTFIALLAAFFGVTMLAALSAWWVWRGRKSGAVLNLSPTANRGDLLARVRAAVPLALRRSSGRVAARVVEVAQ